ncbi:DUF4402 domain-containing protein [Novosphingobium sp.]|uniref:DUF4402 domain-containing protein n=1 Tax=Novosphingobium sp. TaxID=1874826 RepID=UPI003B517A84
MTKILLSSVLVLAAAATVSAPAYAASGNSSTASGTALATVVSPITLIHTPAAALNFGIFSTGTGGSVVVTPAGAGSTTGDTAFVTGNLVTADQFTVAGQGARSFTISTAPGTVANGTTTISFSTTPSAASSSLSALGVYTFSVGGTLTLLGTEKAGAYTGSYNATVAYN